MNLNDFTEANRRGWNAAMPYHRKAKDTAWDTSLSDPNFVFTKEPELSMLKELGIEGKDIVHLCCNNGLELMSLKRLGARRCVGFDISDEAIHDAKARAARFGMDVQFQRTSVYDIHEEFFHSFDLVYITIGALTWLPDLAMFFAMAAKLLRSEGRFFIYEQHPFAMVLPWDVAGLQDKVELANNYFYDEPQVFADGLDYYGNQSYEAPDTYEFMHTMSDILNAVAVNGFCLNSLHEYEHDISCGLDWVQKTGLRLPLSYILIAQLMAKPIL